jgi:hypothetical protein
MTTEFFHAGRGMQNTKLFWGGLITGVGLGLMLGAALFYLELVASGHKAWLAIPSVLLIGMGRYVTQKNPNDG